MRRQRASTVAWSYASRRPGSGAKGEERRVHDTKGIPTPCPAQTQMACGPTSTRALMEAGRRKSRSATRGATPDLRRFAEVDAESLRGTPRATCAGSARPSRTPRSGWPTWREIVGGYVLLPVVSSSGADRSRRRGSPPSWCIPPGVAAALRGALMRTASPFARERRGAVAPLHAATVRLYRRWGWEVCAQTLRQIVQTAALTGFSGSGRVRGNPDRTAVEACAGRTSFGGMVLSIVPTGSSPCMDPADGATPRFEYGWYEGETLTGYVRYESGASVWELDTPAGAGVHRHDTGRHAGPARLPRRQESQSSDVVFVHSALVDVSPLLWLSPSRIATSRCRASLLDAALVSVEAAMTARGWPARAAGRVELEVTDPVTGVERLVLEVEGGSARVTRAGAVRFGAASVPSRRGTRVRCAHRTPSGSDSSRATPTRWPRWTAWSPAGCPGCLTTSDRRCPTPRCSTSACRGCTRSTQRRHTAER